MTIDATYLASGRESHPNQNMATKHNQVHPITTHQNIGLDGLVDTVQQAHGQVALVHFPNEYEGQNYHQPRRA